MFENHLLAKFHSNGSRLFPLHPNLSLKKCWQNQNFCNMLYQLPNPLDRWSLRLAFEKHNCSQVVAAFWLLSHLILFFSVLRVVNYLHFLLRPQYFTIEISTELIIWGRMWIYWVKVCMRTWFARITEFSRPGTSIKNYCTDICSIQCIFTQQNVKNHLQSIPFSV